MACGLDGFGELGRGGVAELFAVLIAV